MNKREFFGVAGVGVSSLFLPQISKAGDSVKPTMEGYTDEDMAAMIAEYLQTKKSTFYSAKANIISIYECYASYCSWVVRGTKIHVTNGQFVDLSEDDSRIINIENLDTIYLTYRDETQTRIQTKYCRKKSLGGWFTLGPTRDY